MSSYLILVLFVVVIVIGTINKVNCFDSFLKGSKQGLTSTINMFSSLLTFTIAITLLLNCGIIEFLKNKLNFDYSLILIQAFVRPMSSSASLSIMTQIYSQYGVDSLKSIISSMIHYVSDASLYIIPFYCSYYNIKKYDKILCFGLIINIFSYLVSIVIVILFYKFIVL
ncbi:MAG: hypothetical protein IJO27_05610 [Bacilli bacterium]|nr:hypothetical protein [Bacilli bacterium]